MAKERRAARLEHMLDKIKEGDPRLWRHPLAEAVVELLAHDETVTIESLIARLEAGFDPEDVTVRRASSEAAIERLREIIQMKK